MSICRRMCLLMIFRGQLAVMANILSPSPRNAVSFMFSSNLWQSRQVFKNVYQKTELISVPFTQEN